jgi:anti-sigma B factor antagonist
MLRMQHSTKPPGANGAATWSTQRSGEVLKNRQRRGAEWPSLSCRTEAIAQTTGEVETLVLHFEGEVDLATAPLFANAIEEAFRAGPPIIVDLRGVSYMDGSGIAVLQRAARSTRTRFVVLGSTPPIHRLLNILGLTRGFPAVSSFRAARAYLRNQ